jgi:hypothetical protein
VINAARQREEALHARGEILLDLLRRHAGIKHGHDDHGHLDLGEQIHRQAHQARQTDDERGKARDDDEIGIAEGEARHESVSGSSVENTVNGITQFFTVTCPRGRVRALFFRVR